MANEKTENGVQGFPYLKPPEKTTWEKVYTAIYDKSDNTILGRTPLSWGLAGRIKSYSEPVVAHKYTMAYKYTNVRIWRTSRVK
ncbi:hypothetical protein Trydic_g22376 [Trypoxylus dichotomus]